jgi:hypothetical protein
MFVRIRLTKKRQYLGTEMYKTCALNAEDALEEAKVICVLLLCCVVLEADVVDLADTAADLQPAGGPPHW